MPTTLPPPLAEPPVRLLPAGRGPGWRAAEARWRHDGVLVAVGNRSDWGQGKSGSRYLVAAVLSRLLGLDRAVVGTERDGRRRPFPVDLRSGARLPVDLNLSHTGDLLVLGVSRTGRIGVDVERADRDIAVGTQLLGRFCHPAEVRAVTALPPHARTDAIARLWVCKEAVAKADGRGLAMDFAKVRVDRQRPGWALGATRLAAPGIPAGYWLGSALRTEVH